jgi:hypothetical protein
VGSQWTKKIRFLVVSIIRGPGGEKEKEIIEKN